MENKTVEMVVKDLLLADNQKKKKKKSQSRFYLRYSENDFRTSRFVVPERKGMWIPLVKNPCL